jgi:hypothetical protein
MVHRLVNKIEKPVVVTNPIALIEGDIEKTLFDKAVALLFDPVWTNFGTDGADPARAAMLFTERYMELLKDAFVDHVIRTKSQALAKRRISWQAAENDAFEFVSRFHTGAYKRPWSGRFLFVQPEWFSLHRAVIEITRLHETAPWFGCDDRESLFSSQAESGSWKTNAIQEAKRRIDLLNMAVVPGESQHKKSISVKGEMERVLKRPTRLLEPYAHILTDIEWSVGVLRFDHHWNITKISLAMDRDRKTIRETIDRVTRKIDNRPQKGKGTKSALASKEARDLEESWIRNIDEGRRLPPTKK